MTETTDRTRRGRLIFLVLVLVFFGPLAVAWIWYYGAGGVTGTPGTNHGDLVNSTGPLSRMALPSLDGGYTEADFLTGKWSLIYIDGADCPAECRETLVDIRQLRLTFGKDMGRIQRVFMYLGDAPDRDYLNTDHPGLISVRVESQSPILADFPVYDGIPVREAGRIYVTDPLGNLVLSYHPDTVLTGIKKDLKRLLTLSHIG